jgi:hypothetical protein
MIPGIVVLHPLLGNTLKEIRLLLPDIKGPVHGRFQGIVISLEEYKAVALFGGWF